MYDLYRIAHFIKVEPFRAQTYFHLIERAVNQAIIQHERIIQDDLSLRKVTDSLFEAVRSARMKKAIPSPPVMDALNRKREKINITLFSDIHQYLIAWAGAWKLFKKLRKVQPLFETIPKKFVKSLIVHKNCRNDLEHIEDRVEEGVADLGNLSNGKFTFGRKQLDISDRDLQTLKDFYERLIQIAKERFEQPFL